MITYLAKRAWVNSIEPMLDDWAPGLRRIIDVASYEGLARGQTLRAGAIVFSDLERLSQSELAFASAVRQAARTQTPEVSVLNDPDQSMRRYDLLHALHASGMNRVRGYRLSDTFTPHRFPVFLRYEDQHTGSITPLLHDQASLDRAIVRARVRGHNLRRLMMVEFVDTSVDGWFRKYGAFIIGDTVLPRSVAISRSWMVKHSDEAPANQERESREYVSMNPDADRLKALFDAASITYGRIDYSLLGDEIVVWEINTNPLIIYGRSHYIDSEIIGRQEAFVASFVERFEALTSSTSAEELSLTGIDDAVRRRAHRAPENGRASRVRRVVHANKGLLKPFAGVVEGALMPFESVVIARMDRRMHG